VETNNKHQYDEILNKDKTFKKVENECHGIVAQIKRMNEQIVVMDREKEKYGITAAQANAKYFHTLEEIKLKDSLMAEFHKKNLESESRLKQQQNLYEAVRTDRNMQCKALAET